MGLKNRLKRSIFKLMKRMLPPHEALLRDLARRPSITIAIPKSSESWVEQGRKFLSDHEYDQALVAFQNAVGQNPKSAWAWHGLGDLHQLERRFEKALDAYSKACSFSSNEGIHHAGRSNALESLGRLKEAQTSWEQALTLDSSLTWVRKNRADQIIGDPSQLS